MEGDLVTIESATLQLYPVKGTYGGMYPLPQTLSLYTANKDNVTQGVITDLTGNSVQTGNLVVDEVTYEKTYYSFDLTSFLQTNLGTTGYNRQKLQLILPDNLFFTTLQGVIFGDGDNTTNRETTKLIILYKTYQNEKDFVLHFGSLQPCLHTDRSKYHQFTYLHVRLGRNLYR